MAHIAPLYRDSLALLTDLYELTMAHGYWMHGMGERGAIFVASFRRSPFGGEYAVSCGLHSLIELLTRFRFETADVEYLRSLTGVDGKPLFSPDFVNVLRDLALTCDVDAIPEGTLVFPHEPLVRVRGPLLQAQILESAILNQMNFQTLIATKAARICAEARGEPVIEFGLRRAQGIDGGVSASRAAFIGGCAGTSNLLAGKLHGIPVRGTHAHAWVMSFDSELEAFERYAAAMPNNCVFLVDTYNSLEGVRHAVAVGKGLERRGFEMVGIRLDSGDLTELSLKARKILDEGGFPGAVIVASNDLDEHVIRDLKQQGSVVNVWGVGTRLVTAYDQPALGGVYKLSAIRSADDAEWRPKIKLSEQPGKVSIPGILQVRRYFDASGMMGDMIYDELIGASAESVVNVAQTGEHVRFSAMRYDDVLVPVFRAGRCVYSMPGVFEVQAHTRQQLAQLADSVKRLRNPAPYPVGIEPRLYAQRSQLIKRSLEARQ